MKKQKTFLLSIVLTLCLSLTLLLPGNNAKAASANESFIEAAKPVTVCVSMEKFTLGQGYIIEPVLVQVDGHTRASAVIADLLQAKYPDISQPWHMTGTLNEAFYLSSVYDPDRGLPTIPKYIMDKVRINPDDDSEDWLGEFDYYTMSGWMYAVNNIFPNLGASDWLMSDGEVMRWQFTLYGYGSDLGADNMEWGAEDITDVGNKDKLTWAVASCNAVYDKSLRQANASYRHALAVLQNLEAGQAAIDEALNALRQDGPSFLDVNKNAWYKEAVDYVIREGLCQGVSTTEFGVGGTLTRAMVSTVLYRLAGEPAVGSVQSSFSDVSLQAWYAQAVAWAAENGLLSDILTGNAFQPKQIVTRQELAALLYSYAKLNNPQLTGGSDLSGFIDNADIAAQYHDAMAWAVNAGILNGNEKKALLPKNSLTRAEFAAMIMRLAGQEA